MFKRYISILSKIESKMSNKFRENVFRNVFLYPFFILVFQLPIVLTLQGIYSVVLVSLAVVSLIGYFISLKCNVVSQMEYAVMLLLTAILTILSYIGFFIHIEVYNYMFIFLQTVGIMIAMNIFMMYCGESKKMIKHYVMNQFASGYDEKEQEILDHIIQSETILVRHTFSCFKELYKAYLPHLDLYIGVDFSIPQPSGVGHYRIADNFDLVTSYSLLDFIKYIKDNDLKQNEMTRKDFEVFMMSIY